MHNHTSCDPQSGVADHLLRAEPRSIHAYSANPHGIGSAKPPRGRVRMSLASTTWVGATAKRRRRRRSSPAPLLHISPYSFAANKDSLDSTDRKADLPLRSRGRKAAFPPAARSESWLGGCRGLGCQFSTAKSLCGWNPGCHAGTILVNRPYSIVGPMTAVPLCGRYKHGTR